MKSLHVWALSIRGDDTTLALACCMYLNDNGEETEEDIRIHIQGEIFSENRSFNQFLIVDSPLSN